jgi:hypothetical protein
MIINQLVVLLKFFSWLFRCLIYTLMRVMEDMDGGLEKKKNKRFWSIKTMYPK